MIVFLQFRQYITIYMYLHALEICDVQFSITHVQPDHGVWAQIHVNVITPFWIGILLLDLPDQFGMYIKNIVISYMSYLKKQYAPAKFWYMEYTLRRGSVLHEAVLYIIHIQYKKRI